MGLGKCMHCGLELIGPAGADGKFHHIHPDIPDQVYYYCDFMQDALDNPRRFRGLRGTPYPEETIVDQILNKYHESTSK